MGTGKTDNALKYSEIALEKNPDLVVITNIVMLKKIRKWKVIFCNSWFEYIKLLYENPRSILVLDEAGIFASSGYSSKGSDIGQWELFLKMCRKFGVAVFWIDQRDVGSIPPTMRTIAYYHIDKPEMFTMETWRKTKYSKGSKLISKRKLSKKDRTKIPFDTEAPASWNNDMPIWYGEEERQLTIRNLIDRVSNVNGFQIRPTIKEWMEEIKRNQADHSRVLEREKDRADAKDSKKGITLKEVVFFLLSEDEKNERTRKGPSEIGKFFNRKPQSISRIIKEYDIKRTALLSK